jgi:hypothetical protein
MTGGHFAVTTGIVDGQTIDASDVKTPIDALDEALNNYVTGATAIALNCSTTILRSGATPATLTMQGGASGNEGAEIKFDGASGFGRITLDRFGENLRLFHTSGATAQFAISRTTGAFNVYIQDELELDGALNHDGTTVGFFGTTPAVRSTGWAVTNAVSDKVFDANATTTDELADVLGTLITYLISIGLIAA